MATNGIVASINEDGVITETNEVVISVFVRSPYNYDRDAVSHETGLACDDPSRTQQQFLEEADINTIVRQFGLTGQLPQDLAVPQSGDFSNVVDFQSAMNVVRAAEESFMELPGEIRARFANDPGRFLAFVNDESNRDEAVKLGIVNAGTGVPAIKADATNVAVTTPILDPNAKPTA